MTAALVIPTGVRLGQIRAGRRIPQRAIAEKTGVYGRTAVWLWDSGRKSPRISSAVAYAAALDHRFIVRRDSHIICDLERDAGPGSYLDTVERHLVACGYQVALVPADMAVAA